MILAGKIGLKRNTTFKCGLPSEKWWKDFIKRHPEISVRMTEKFGQACTSVSVEDV